MLLLLAAVFGFILLMGFTVFGMTVEQCPVESWKLRDIGQGILVLFGFGIVGILLLGMMFMPSLILLRLHLPYFVSVGIGLPLGFLVLLFGGHFLLERLSQS